MDRLFLDKDAQERAFSDLKGLRQRGKPFENHLAVFQRLVNESGAVLNNRLLRSYLEDSLNDELSREMVGINKKEDFTDFCHQVQRISDDLRRYKNRSRGQNPRDGSRSAPCPAATPALPTPNKPEVMDWEPSVSTARRAR